MKTCLYRLFDKKGTLLYVGVTGRVRARMKQHARKQPWWPEVATRKTVWYGSRPTALANERLAIRTESPLYNFIGSPQQREVMRGLFAARRQSASPEVSP